MWSFSVWLVVAAMLAWLAGVACVSSAPEQQQQSADKRATVVTPAATTATTPARFGQVATLGWDAAQTRTFALLGPAADFGTTGSEATIRTRSPGDERGVMISDFAQRDVDVSLRVRSDRPPSGGDQYIYLVARQASESTYYLGRVRFEADGAVWLQAVRDKDGTVELLGQEARVDVPGSQLSSGIWVHFRVLGVSPTNLLLKSWADGQPEPMAWAYSTLDSADLEQAGAVGVRAYLSRRADNAPVTFGIARFRAEAVEALPAVAVAGIKATAVANSLQARPATPETVAAATQAPQATPIAPQSPIATVDQFYALVQQKQLDRAVELWTPHMQVAFPPAENITQRFSHTRQLIVERADLAALDDSAGWATVAIVLREVLDEAPFERRYSGTWDLVRADGGWRLDQPDLKVQLQP
jgi:hypothetical protein